MARQYGLRYQKRHPIPGDPVSYVSGRMDQEGSQNLPLGSADEISGDEVILSPQFPTRPTFTRIASPSFPTLPTALHTTTQEPLTTPAKPPLTND